MKKFLFTSSFYCLIISQTMFWFVTMLHMLMGQPYKTPLCISGVFAILAIVLGLISQIMKSNQKRV